MGNILDRRDFLKLAGIGGAVFVSGLGFDVLAAEKHAHLKSGKHVFTDFHFVQVSDTHWGFKGPIINPEAENILPMTINRINSLKHKPDFIVFTGDLTHSTDDSQQRRRRMKDFKEIIDDLHVKNIKFLPGEHDAALDNGEAYREFFGDLYYSFDHKGVHFIALDNVSDPAAQLGQSQLDWLKMDLAKLPMDAAIVVLCHRPLFDLFPQWDWFTRDGQAAINLLLPYANVAVFYGHIHQAHQHTTEHITHYAANSLIFPLPAPGSVPKRAPIPWDEHKPYAGLGYRAIEAYPHKKSYQLEEAMLKPGANI
jgi:hypothetical protein